MNVLAITALVDLTSALLSVATKLQAASAVLQKAHTEGWAQDDPRWAEEFKKADQALADALARLRG